jgi:hypothetical protein
MDLRTEELGYSVCFRPLRISDEAIKNLRESTDENLKKNLSPFYACKYLTIPTQDVKAAGSLQQLPASLVDELETEFSQLTKVV